MTFPSPPDPAVEVDILRAHLNEAEAAQPAIRSGCIETLAASDTGLEKVFALRDAEQTYRMMDQRAQEALTDSEERFRQMAENIRDVFYLRDADGDRILYASPAYEEAQVALVATLLDQVAGYLVAKGGTP